MAISWKIEKITDCNNEACNWVSVDPLQGEGDSSPKVTVTAATSPDDCATAYITISASTGQKQELSVIRCLPECSCKSIKFEKTTIANPQPAAGATHLQIGTYDNSSACLDGASISVGGIFTNPSSGEGKIYADVTENTTTSQRTGFFRFTYNGNTCVESEITQEGKANPCATAACPSVTVTPTSFESQGGTGNYNIVGKLDCYRSSVSSDNWITINETNKTFTVGATEKVIPRTGQINFVFTNISTSVQCPTTTISITQSGVPPTPTCNCEDITVSSKTISKNGATQITVLEVSASKIDCPVTDVSVEYNVSDFKAKFGTNASLEINGLSVVAKNITANTSQAGTEEKRFAYTYNYKINGSPCSKNNCEVVQEGESPAGCTCDIMNIRVDRNKIRFENGDVGAAENIEVTLNTSSSCLPSIECTSDGNWLYYTTAKTSDGFIIYAETTSRNETGDNRNGYIKLKDGSNEECTSITLTQPIYEPPTPPTPGCDKRYDRSMITLVRADESLAIAAGVTLGEIGKGELAFTYDVYDLDSESIDLAGAQEKVINPGQTCKWIPTDSLEGVICTDKEGLQDSEFGGFPESFYITFTGGVGEYIANLQDVEGNKWKYSTEGTSYEFYLSYSVSINEEGSVVFTIIIGEDNKI